MLKTPDIRLPKITPYSWLIINVDASFVNLSSASCVAGVAFDCTSTWILGFQRKVYANNALHAEILSVF